MSRALIIIVFLISASAPLSLADDTTRVVTNIETWKHPTKKVFQNYGITLLKVELTKKGKYATFFVQLPYDPQSSENDRYYNRLYLELLRANGWWDYSLDDDEDGLVIAIKWDKKLQTMHKEYLNKERH